MWSSFAQPALGSLSRQNSPLTIDCSSAYPDGAFLGTTYINHSLNTTKEYLLATALPCRRQRYPVASLLERVSLALDEARQTCAIRHLISMPRCDGHFIGWLALSIFPGLFHNRQQQPSKPFPPQAFFFFTALSGLGGSHFA